MSNTTHTWVLVASRAGARLYDAEKGRHPHVLETLEHPEGRRINQEINSDRPGRSFDRTSGTRHALGGSDDPHEHQAVMFAQDLAQRLHKARVDHKAQRLLLVAEPRFLGYLRRALDQPTLAIVADEIAKDWIPLPVAEIDRNVREALDHQA